MRSHLLPALASLLISGPLASPAYGQPTRPNIVVIMTDDQNVDSLPVMRKLNSYPEGSWVKFTNAYVNDSICCPARATFLTGQYSHNTGVTDNKRGNVLDDANTLAVWLHEAGYRTALIGRYLNGYPWGRTHIPPGWDLWKQSGVGNVKDKITDAINFINRSDSQPFFAYVAHDDPHHKAKPLPRYATAEVYVPPDPPNYNEQDVSDKPKWIRNLRLLAQPRMDAWHTERIASQRALLGVDDGIERMVQALKANGKLDNTMIMFLADHGFSWGSHRWIKKHCFYEECSRIPLYVRFPGATGNHEETRLVSNVDLAATIADYAGVTPGLPQDGRSLIPLLDGTATDWTEAALLEVVATTNRGFYGIVVPGWKYAEYYNGDKELYDLANDPAELQNQASNPAFQAKKDELAQRLRELKGF
jgi:arylsulfatase A-like enzyme